MEDPPTTEIEEMYEDVFVPELFDCSPALMNKTNDFTYFSNFFHGMYNMSIFDINSTKVEAFNLGTCENPRNISITSEVTSEERKKIRGSIKNFARVFAWSYEDMPGVDRSIAQHVIPTYPQIRPIKWKLHRMRPEWADKVKEEVKK